jgi:hypothetical protein
MGVEDTFVFVVLDAIAIVEVSELFVLEEYLFVGSGLCMKLDVSNIFDGQEYIKEDGVGFGVFELQDRDMCAKVDRRNDGFCKCFVDSNLASLGIYRSDFVSLVVVHP